MFLILIAGMCFGHVLLPTPAGYSANCSHAALFTARDETNFCAKVQKTDLVCRAGESKVQAADLQW